MSKYHNVVKNIKYSKSNIPNLAKYDRIKEGLKKINLRKKNKILDLGCGAGQALYALRQIGYKGAYLGLDNDPDILKKSNLYYKKNNYKNFELNNTDINKFHSKEKFDLILVWGVISFFDDYKNLFNKLDKLLIKDGVISIFSGFSENDYNVYVKYKLNNQPMQPGLNMHSINSVESYIKKKKYKIYKKKFFPNQKLKKNKNPLSSFMLFDENKNKILANGLNIIRKFYFLNARKL